MQQRAAAASAKIQVVPLRGNVSALLGSGGNIAVLTGPDGKIVVDSGYSSSQPQIAAALAGLGAQPLKTLINTHWHFDHTDGNAWMHSAGATILAHSKTLDRLSTVQTIAAFNATFPPAPRAAWPTEIFDQDKTLKVNGETLALLHYAPAHTDTDLWVHFTSSDVLHVGDTWFNGYYPFIDYSTGGSIDGMIAATEKNLAHVGKDTRIVPGHGPIGDKAALIEFRDMLAGVRDKVAALKRQGRTLAEVEAAKPTAAYDERWGGKAKAPGAFVGLVYQGV